MNFFAKNYKAIIASTVMFLGSILIFSRIYSRSDLILHARIAMDYMLHNKSLPSNSLYYHIIIYFGGINNIKTASIIILGDFVLAKFIVVHKYIIEKCITRISCESCLYIAFIMLLLSPIYLPQLFRPVRFKIVTLCEQFSPNSVSACSI